MKSSTLSSIGFYRYILLIKSCLNQFSIKTEGLHSLSLPKYQRLSPVQPSSQQCGLCSLLLKVLSSRYDPGCNCKALYKAQRQQLPLNEFLWSVSEQETQPDVVEDGGQLPVDMFYDYEQLVSKASVSPESDIPLHLLHLSYPCAPLLSSQFLSKTVSLP
uniref:Uncharacterized protein n=1 Tax=Neogobius melanostomus TaxID=47308 RepID=A0A8C6WR94_9GOBI